MSKSDGKPHPGPGSGHAVGILDLSFENKNLLAAGVVVIGNMEIGQHAAQPGRFRQFARIIKLDFMGAAAAPSSQASGEFESRRIRADPSPTP